MTLISKILINFKIKHKNNKMMKMMMKMMMMALIAYRKTNNSNNSNNKTQRRALNKTHNHLHLKDQKGNNCQKDITEEQKCKLLFKKESNKTKMIYGSSQWALTTSKNKVSTKKASIHRIAVFALHKSKTLKILILTSMRVQMLKILIVMKILKKLLLSELRNS